MISISTSQPLQINPYNTEYVYLNKFIEYHHEKREKDNKNHKQFEF